MEKFFNAYIIIYPVLMSIIWSIGAIIHYFMFERSYKLTNLEQPFVSILVPCYNESENIEEIIYRLSNLNYKHYEIIAIDDGSTDNTASILNVIAQSNPLLRVVLSKQNRGKANALHLGLLSSNGEFLVCVDADAYLDADAINYMIPYFLDENNGQNIAAVTGNPQVRNRNSILAKIQVAEFASIVGAIKRTQQLGSLVMTVSGVIVTFRKQALLDIGLWDRDMITEDIAVTWKFHQNSWKIKYEPRAICWMLVPETLSGLWNQRVRWAQGGVEVLLRHFSNSLKHARFPVILLFEQILGIIWAYLWVFHFINFIFFNTSINNNWFQSYFLEITCLFQFSISIYIASKHDKTIIKEIFWVIWYPLVYWYFNAFCIVFSFMKTVLESKATFAKWNSPDRGNPSTEDVDIDLQIEKRIDLEHHIKTTYQSTFFKYLELIITIILWVLFLITTQRLFMYFYYNSLIFNVNWITLAFNSSYSAYFTAYILSITSSLILIFLYTASSKFINQKNSVKDFEPLKIIEHFNLSISEIHQLQSTQIQEIDNNKIDIYHQQQEDRT